MSKARDIASATPAPSTVSSTELGYLDGVTSAIQTQIDGKQAANANVSTTELGYLDGVTSAIQTQLDGKIAKTLTTTTGDMIYASSANTPARLGIGSTGQVLTVSGGVPTWAAAAGGGKVLQVVEAQYATQASTTSTSYSDTGLSATITPSSTSSKILVIVAQWLGKQGSSSADAVGVKLVRGSTDINAGGTGAQFYMNNTMYMRASVILMALDSPSTTSATTYKTQFNSNSSGSSAYAQIDNYRSSITLLEIGA